MRAPPPLTIVLSLLVVVILLGGLWMAGAFGSESGTARHNIHKTLEELGFIGPLVHPPATDSAPFTFDKIVLDPDEFGRIQELRLTPPGLFDFGKKRFKRLEIDGLALTGGIDKQGIFSLSGVVADNRLTTKEGLLQILNLADTLVLNKARLDILSDALGGIGLEATLELRRVEGTIQILGTARSVQKQFTLEGKVSGTISPDTGEWELALEIEQGKADIGPLLLTRLYGEISMAGAGWTLNSLYGQSTAGSMSYYGYAFQAPSFTFEQRGGVFKTLAEAKDKPEKAIDAQGLEFGFLYSSAKPDKIQTSVFSPDLPLLLKFLKMPSDTDTAPVKTYKNINLVMETPFMAAENKEIRIPFIIKSQENTPEKSGFALLNIEKDYKKAEISNIFWND
jgi:hypothetical protein